LRPRSDQPGRADLAEQPDPRRAAPRADRRKFDDTGDAVVVKSRAPTAGVAQLSPRPPPDPRHPAPNADRSELAGSADTAVGSRPRSDQPGRADPRQQPALGAQRRARIEVRSPAARTLPSVPDEDQDDWTRPTSVSLSLAPPPNLQTRSAECGSILPISWSNERGSNLCAAMRSKGRLPRDPQALVRHLF
jgi:hypothetical protein